MRKKRTRTTQRASPLQAEDAGTRAFDTVRWVGDASSGCLRLIDQTLLPLEPGLIRLSGGRRSLGGDPVAPSAGARLRSGSRPPIAAVLGGQEVVENEGSIPELIQAVKGATSYLRTQPADGREPVLGFGSSPTGPLEVAAEVDGRGVCSKIFFPRLERSLRKIGRCAGLLDRTAHRSSLRVRGS